MVSFPVGRQAGSNGVIQGTVSFAAGRIGVLGRYNPSLTLQ